MSTLIRVPVDIRIPEQTGIQGNSFWTVQSGTVAQLGFWAFLGNVTGAITYGFVQVPPNVDPGSVGKLIVALGASATAASLSAWRVGTKEIQTGASFDVPSWVHENAVNWTAPTTAWARLDLSFTLTSATTANAILAVKLERDSDGTSATENCTALIGCFDMFLEITATA